MSDNKRIIAGYGRVSTLLQAIKGTSAEDQKNRIEKECDKNGWRLYKFYSDEGFSGKTMENRPGIQKLIKDAKDGYFNTVLFTKLDRVGRSLREILNFWELIRNEYKLDLICIDTPAINTDTPYSKVILGMLGGFAEFERELIRERMSGGRFIKWKEGKIVVGALPYGYEWDKEAETIKKHDEQGDIVRRIYSMYLHENYSMKDIAIKLTEGGVPTPSVGKNWKKIVPASRWNNYSVGKILENQAYTGREITLNKNKRTTAISKRTKREYMYTIDELKPDSEWIKITFPPLITEELWEQAQKRIKYQQRKPKKRHIEYEKHFLSENVVYCYECGSRMRKKLKKDKTNKGNKARFYYVCYWKGCSKKELEIKGRDRCTLSSIDAELVDHDVWNEIVSVISNPAKHAEQWFINPDIDELKKRIEKLKIDEKSALQKSLVGFKYVTSERDPDLKKTYDDELRKYEEEYLDIKHHRQKAELELEVTANKVDRLAEFKKYVESEAKKTKIDRWYNGDDLSSYDKDIKRFLNSLPFNEKKRLVEAVISPESGGRVFIKYQRANDYMDEEDLLILEPELLNEPQPDRPKIAVFRFFIDLERVKAIITGLNKNKLLKKLDSSGIAGRLYSPD